jgi:hypothetical protein
VFIASSVLLVSPVPSPEAGAADVQPSRSASTDEVVVTAFRSGIPVWRVDGPGSTLVLVGTIGEVSKGTRWNPESLAAALRQAQQVMFPASVQYNASLPSAFGWAAKARRMASLPNGHTVAEYVSPADHQHLVRLEQLGMLKPGFEREHPLQIVHELIQYGSGERPSTGFFSIARVRPETDPEAFVRSTVRKYRLNLVPVRRAELKPIVTAMFNAPPAEHAACLRAAMAMAEAGPTAMSERSAAWAQRRIRAVLNSPAQRAFDACRPVGTAPALTTQVRSTVRSLLAQPLTTVAVFDLPLLARPGALLDELSAAGFQIRGPAWK